MWWRSDGLAVAAFGQHVPRVRLGLRCPLHSDRTGFLGAVGWCHKVHMLRGQAVAVGLHFLVSVADSHAFDSCAP